MSKNPRIPLSLANKILGPAPKEALLEQTRIFMLYICTIYEQSIATKLV